MTSHARTFALGAALTLVFAACGGSGPTAAPGAATQPPAAGGQTSNPNPGGGGGANRGFDCAVLVTPAELDQISGFKGGNVTTTSRGDQNPGTPGYGECSFEEGAASTWFGTIAIATGDALDSFGIQYDFNKENGATAESGLGAEAILVRSDAGTEIFAKSSDGVGITVSLAWDTSETTDDKALAAIRKIVQTALDRV
jgi:hypothetical protein